MPTSAIALLRVAIRGTAVGPAPSRFAGWLLLVVRGGLFLRYLHPGAVRQAFWRIQHHRFAAGHAVQHLAVVAEGAAELQRAAAGATFAVLQVGDHEGDVGAIARDDR